MTSNATLRQRFSTWWQGRLSILRGLAGVAIIAAVLTIGYFGPHWLFDERRTGSEPGTSAPEPAGAGVRDLVELTPEKLAAAQISVQPLGTQHLLKSLRVSGTVRYNETVYLELRSPAAGVVQEVFVKPSEVVAAGAPLVAITSEQMGEARRARAHDQALLQLAESQAAWSRSLQDGVAQLLEQLKPGAAGQPTRVFEPSALANQKMGQFGERLLKAQAVWELAQANLANASQLTGVLSGRELREREAALQQATAAFQGEIEQIRFDAEQQLKTDLAAVADARHRVAIAEDKIAAMLGPAGLDEPEAQSSRLLLTVPFAGRIEAIHLVPGEQVDQGENLLVLADPEQLWVAAEVSEVHLSQLQTELATPVRIQAPSQTDLTWTGQLRFVGARVDPLTRTIPIIFDLQNSTGQLRAGMLVWVELPLSESKDGLAVPASALARHDRDVFVFVQEAPGRFRRVSVEVLSETAEWAEIASAELHPGTPIVDGGVFFLKSELLLEAEE